MREAIARLPAGTYNDTVYFDGWGQPLWLKLALTVDADGMLLDFAGSAAQMDVGINCVPNYAMAYANFILKCILCPDIPHNGGTFAPIRFRFPEGSIVNPTFPAPVAARHVTGHYAAFVVLGVLRQLAPERMMAESAGPGSATMQLDGSLDDDRRYSLLFFNPGGLGARSTGDGLPTINFPPNRWNIPTEVVETVTPIVVLEKELLQDSGGAGQFRGGLGQRVTFLLNAQRPAWMAAMLERVAIPARGFSGGLEGGKAAVSINGEPVHPKKRHRLQPGDIVTACTAGGGGYGSPEARPPEEVAADVRLGYVSASQAMAVYRVAMEANGQAIDWATTRRLREKRTVNPVEGRSGPDEK
jgi:N-methylhydantoinase B